MCREDIMGSQEKFVINIYLNVLESNRVSSIEVVKLSSHKNVLFICLKNGLLNVQTVPA